MGSLLLIRHGQAAFRSADYDQLSELGVAQARALGRHFAERRRTVDALYSGPRKRQIDTARHLAAAAADAGFSLPEMAILDELDEFPFEKILATMAPRLLAERPELADPDAPIPERADKIFHLSIEAWVHGRADGEFESYADFRARVERGIAAVIAACGRGRTAALVTSGGPIAAALSQALALSPEAALKVQLVTANASLTELKYRGEELSATGWNQVAHLLPEHVTYR